MIKKYILFWGQIVISVLPILSFMISPPNSSNLFTYILYFIFAIPSIWFLLSNLFILLFTYKLLVEKPERCFFDFAKRWLFSTVFCYGMYYILLHLYIIIEYAT